MSSMFFGRPLDLRFAGAGTSTASAARALTDGEPQRVIADHDQQLAKVKEFIRNARSELWMSGTHFQITLYNQVDAIADAVLRGVNVRILMYDPKAPSIDEVARTLRHNGSGLSTEICAAIKNIEVLNQRIALKKKQEKNLGLTKFGSVSAKLFASEIPHGRVYMMDPDDEAGEILTIPYLNLQVDTNAPGFLFSNRSSPGQTYYLATKNHWQNSKSLLERAASNICPARG